MVLYYFGSLSRILVLSWLTVMFSLIVVLGEDLAVCGPPESPDGLVPSQLLKVVCNHSYFFAK